MDSVLCEMAQGLDVRSLSSAKSPPIDSKTGEPVKRTRGMGSRRIFSPQFKLQVLDSYRNDVDCRGNQRATARKYNIHRRQIQKWLQCEQSLRTSVEESGKIETADLTGSKSRKKVEAEDKTDLTLNQSATAFARLGDAGRHDEERAAKPILKQDCKMYAAEESKIEAQNLKRVAQKLYPSLQNIPCVPGEKVAQPGAHVEGQKYFRGDVACAFGLSPSSTDKRDDNFNKVIRTDGEPLDLKSKVRSEILPEEFLASNVYGSSTEEKPDKLRIGAEDNCQSGLTSSSENIGGPKLSVSNAVLKCLVQKYNMGGIDGQELCTQDSEKNKLLCSPSVNSAESSCLLEVPVPKNSSYSPDSAVKRKLDSDEESDIAASKLKSSSECFSSDTCPKKCKIETGMHSKALNRFEHTKSFSPKRKWIKESMQDMLEDADQTQETSSLPIKQRVKMNLRSLPEATYKLEDCNKSNGVSSNFTIEKLCSTDSARETETSDCYGQRSCTLATCESSYAYPAPPPPPPPPPPLVLSNRIVPDLVSLNLKPDTYNHDSDLRVRDYNPSEYPLNVPLKEEKISDSEDMDVDILSTTPVEKKSFDFSGYNFGKRRSFSVQFKLTVLDAFYNDKDCNKNQRATARKFNINRRQVQKWLSQENDLRSESSLKSGKYLQRQRLGGETRESDGCTRCPQHCLRKKEETYTFNQTIEVNVKPCSDNECLSRRDKFDPDHSKTGLTGGGVDFYSKTLFPGDLKTANFYHNYLYPDNNNMVYHDSILGWSPFNSSALSVPNFQCLSTWHHNFDFCQENPKIY